MKIKKQLLLMTLLLSGSSNFLVAADYLWNANSTTTSPGDWATPGNWNPGTGLPGSDEVNDRVFLNRGSLSDTTKGIVLDSDRTIGLLGVKYLPTSSDGGPIAYRISGGHRLTIGNASTGGKLYVGVSQNNGVVATGTLQISGGATIALVGGEFLVGAQHSGASGKSQLSGTVQMMSEDARLEIGTTENRSAWVLGDQTYGTNQWKSTGTFETTGSTPGGQLEAWLTRLEIGRWTNNGPGSTFVQSAASSGTVNLVNLTAAQIDTLSLKVGESLNGSTNGTLHLGKHSLRVHQSVEIGVGRAAAGTTEGQNENVVAGTVTMDEGSSVTFGSTGERATLVMATNQTSRVAANGKVERTASLVASGGEFSAYLSTLTLGAQNATAADRFYQAEGTLDLRAASVSAFDVAGDVVIGNGDGEGSIGRLYLPEADARIGGNLLLGDSASGGGEQASSEGLLHLNGTRLTVDGDVTVELTGRVEVTLENGSAGLLLSNETAAFSINSLGGYLMTFETEAALGWYGLAWKGDNLSSLQAMIGAGTIGWINHTDYTIAAFYDSTGDMTYIGVIPEPSTVALLMFGGALLAAGSRRRFH